MRRQFVDYIENSGNFSFTPVVCHCDLGAEHILTVNQAVVGVIDFSDVSFGDPDYDFSPLFIDVGEEFTIEVAQRYGHLNLDQLKAKLRYFAVADFVDTIVHGEGQALEGQQELAWQRLEA